LTFKQKNIIYLNMSRRTFKYRIYPTKKQITSLNKTLSGCQKLYNFFLEDRKTAYNKDKKSVSCYDQQKKIKDLKKEVPILSEIHSQVLQNVAVRVDLAYQAFFRRVKSKKGKAGFPRFKAWNRYDSFTFPQSGFKIIEDKSVVQLSKIGRIKIKQHRPIIGVIKNCTIKKTPTGKWFVSFSCDNPSVAVNKQFGRVCGIDVGLEHFATLSNGTHIENPKFFRSEEKSLAKAQRKLSTQKRGSTGRTKAKKVVAKIHERIKNKRHNFIHQVSKKLVADFKFIVVEDLNINNMMKGNFKSMNKSIGDASWRLFIEQLESKAEEAGSQVIKVNPAYTSQTCPRCGNREKKSLSDRVHKCSCCHYSLQRDHAAAINILTLGQQSLA